MQDCGGCDFWWKAKSSRSGETYGVCEKLDCRCNSDDGKTCTSFKRPKFERKQKQTE